MHDILDLNPSRRIKDLDEDGEIIREALPVNQLPASSSASFKSFEDFYKACGGQKLTSHGVAELDPENLVSLGGGLYQYHDPQTGKSFFAHDPSWTPGWLAKGEKLKSAVAAKHGEPRFCSDCHLNQLPYSYAYDTCSTCNNAKVGTPWYADEFGRRFPL